MSLLALHLPQGQPSFRQRQTLDGREYVLACRWSMREERWYLDLFDAKGTLLAGSVKLVLHEPLLAPFGRRDAMPAGELLLLDQRPTPAPPGLDELGSVVQLLYLEAA